MTKQDATLPSNCPVGLTAELWETRLTEQSGRPKEKGVPEGPRPGWSCWAGASRVRPGR